MNVVFLAPSYPPEMQQYTRGLAEVGVNVLGVGDSPRGALPASLKPYLAESHKLLSEFTWEAIHNKREFNSFADGLIREYYEAHVRHTL